MNYQHFLFSQLFMNHIETNETRYKDLSYDTIYGEVLMHLDEFSSSNFNVDTRSEYDCITDYLSHNILSKLAEEEEIKCMKSMMDSIYTYGKLESTDSYLVDYYVKLGSDVFNKTFNDHSKYLSENYSIDENVYQDYEGITYNSLILNK